MFDYREVVRMRVGGTVVMRVIVGVRGHCKIVSKKVSCLTVKDEHEKRDKKECLSCEYQTRKAQ